MPPWMVPVLSVVCGTAKAASCGSAAAMRAPSDRMCAISSAANSMAFTPCGASAECASLPRTQQRYSRLPLCATTARIEVGSPTMQPAGRIPLASRSRSRPRTPTQPISSSYDSDRWKLAWPSAAMKSGTVASATAMKLFMSAVPRPYRRPSRICASNGSVSQGWPSTGTTSVWPDSTSPGLRPGDSVANRLALPPVAS